MDFSVPKFLEVFRQAAAVMKAFAKWRTKSTGDKRTLILELEENLRYLNMVAEDGVPIGDVVERLRSSAYETLSTSGFDFNSLESSRIASHPSLKGTDLQRWIHKDTGSLVESIYRKIKDLKVMYPIVGKKRRRLWKVRVNNIRKRIWLLLKHVRA